MSNPRRYIELILSNRIFSALTPMDAAALYKAGGLVRIQPGEVIARQGSQADGFYLILAGRFGVYSETATERIKIAEVGVGETVGEMGLVMAGARTATVEAIDPALVWNLPADVFEGLLRRGDPIGTSILRGIGKDLCRRFRKVLEEGRILSLELNHQSSGLDTVSWEF